MQRLFHAPLTLMLAGLVACSVTPAISAGQQAGGSSAADAAVDAQSKAQRQAQAEPDSDPESLPELADGGAFDSVLARLKASPGAEQPAIAELISQLQLHADHERTREATQSRKLAEAMERVRSLKADDQIEAALVAAIEAVSLAPDAQAHLNDPVIRGLSDRAAAKAQASRESQDWLNMLGLYRLLNLLHEDTGQYREPVEEAARHLRVLQMYAPDALEAMADRRIEERRAAAQARGEQFPATQPATQPAIEPRDDAERSEASDPQPPRPWDNDEDAIDSERETWQQRLEGLDLSMLRQTLAQSARSHVEANGYAPLMAGAVDSLRTLLATPEAAESFDSLRDARKVERFRGFLDDIATDLDQPDREMNFLQAAALIDRVVTMNSASVDLPESVLVYEMTEGAMFTLDDFTSVIWPRDLEQFGRSTQGRFTGVGIQISRRDGRLIVVSPLPDTPAQAAGVKPGDIIEEVNGQTTSTWSLDRAVREITGPEGTTVTLGLEREGEPQLVQTPIKRSEILIASISGWERQPRGKWSYWIDPTARIGYIRLSQFIPQTADDLDAAIAQMQQDGPINGLILDLRFNPGGLLSSAIDVVDRFVDNGPIVFTVDATGERTSERRARRTNTYLKFPVVVLINQGAASASEIVSGALQDYDRGLVVGTRSFGKGSVQELLPLARGNALLKLTTRYYMLPGGRIIHRKPAAKTWGVEPDLEVRMTDQEVADSVKLRQELDVLRGPNEADHPKADDILATGVDPQLEAAVLILKTHLLANDVAVAAKQ